MKVSGFTFIKNAEMLGYPFIESIQSVLPIVDEFVIAVGESDDNTLEIIKSIKDDKLELSKLNGMSRCKIVVMFMHNKK